MLRECEYSFLYLHELTCQRRNIIRCRIQREMTTIDNVDFGIGHISPVRFRLRGVKRCLVLAPNHQEARLLLTHPSLPPGIVFYVGAVVVEEVALNLDLAGLIEKCKFMRPQIGVIAFHVGIASYMARPRSR